LNTTPKGAPLNISLAWKILFEKNALAYFLQLLERENSLKYHHRGLYRKKARVFAQGKHFSCKSNIDILLASILSPGKLL
jgi:hypothetical protein